MAYTEKELQEHISELQQYLRTISRSNSSIPTIVPNGIYDPLTEEAVRRFQQDYGLPVTGKVDNATWDKIYEVYRSVQEFYEDIAAILPVPSAEQSNMREGYSGFAVYILQAMLNTISSFYGNLNDIEISGKYGKETAEAVADLQDIIGQPRTGEVDFRTWNRLAQLYNYHAGLDAENNGNQQKISGG